MIGYKVFTADLRPPVQGRDPVWDGTTPYHLPTVAVDTGPDDCGAGWNFCRSAATALRIAGLWPDGRPSRLYRVEAAECVERGDKCRAGSLRIVDEVTDLRPAIEELSAPFGDLADEMVDEQLAWREALGRPLHDPATVEAGLREALQARGLDWQLRCYDSARDAWPAWAAWDARAAWAARDAWAAWKAWAAWDAWAARDAWPAWDACPAWDAWDALSLHYASRRGWISHPADMLTRGIREAYRHGLAVTVPVAPDVLGWAMDETLTPAGQ